ncbi:lysin B [Mycobacterium phage Compostia]|nr:lysin B [Mycobacterium phage Compostia]QUE25818.1 lysin B [Mycobacterium phage GlenHope]WGH22147.1 lysin B [Mycobacterium phage Kronus]
MHLAGQYVGLGIGGPDDLGPDVSDEIANIKRFLRGKFTPARNTLDEGPVFTPALVAEVIRIQGVYIDQGRLTPEQVIPGVINLAFKYAVNYLSREVILPLTFSVEGHMSDMWIGPAAWVGEVLRAEGRALHFPTAYDRFALPFKNETGVRELARRVGQTVQDNGVKFPAGTPWVGTAFSQGSMIWCDFYRQYLMPGKPLHWRLKDLVAAVVCGNPDREKGVVAPWIPDPPAPDRQGIMDDADRMVNTPPGWVEIARRGDLYTDNESTGERGLNKTAIAKIITQNKWWGGPAGLVARVTDLVSGPADDLVPIALALYDAIRFVGTGLQAHGGYDMEPAAQFVRERLATRKNILVA